MLGWRDPLVQCSLGDPALPLTLCPLLKPAEQSSIKVIMQKGGRKPALSSRKGTQTIREVTLELSAHWTLWECWSQARDRGPGTASIASPSFPAQMAPRTREGPGPPAHSTATAQPSRAGGERQGGIPRSSYPATASVKHSSPQTWHLAALGWILLICCQAA